MISVLLLHSELANQVAHPSRHNGFSGSGVGHGPTETIRNPFGVSEMLLKGLPDFYYHEPGLLGEMSSVSLKESASK